MDCLKKEIEEKIKQYNEVNLEYYEEDQDFGYYFDESYNEKDLTILLKNLKRAIKENKAIRLCSKGYSLQKLLGIGAYGKVYLACKPDCNYAIKIQPVFPKTEPNFIKEAETSQYFGEKNIGPKIYGWWICEKKWIYCNGKI